MRPDSPQFWPVAAGITLIVALACAALYSAVDIPAAEWMHRFRDDRWVSVLRTITRIGESHWVLVPAFVLFLVWRKPRPERARRALFISVTVGVVGLAALVSKMVAGRCRPHLWHESAEYGFRWFEVAPAFHAFPSGHATTLFATAAALGLLWPRYRWVLLAFALLLGVSRLAVGRHYLSDVVAGAWFGFFGVYLIARYLPGLGPTRAAEIAYDA